MSICGNKNDILTILTVPKFESLVDFAGKIITQGNIIYKYSKLSLNLLNLKFFFYEMRKKFGSQFKNLQVEKNYVKYPNLVN